MPAVFVILIIAAALLALAVFLAAPGRAPEEGKAAFYGRNIAHRGLHTPDRSVPENSLAAFSAAAAAGYGAELDVQLSADGEVMVFHDDSLRRMCGWEENIWELTAEELRRLRLADTEERIPFFREVLALGAAAGMPLIVELKTGPRNRELCEKTMALLSDYPAAYCVESFNPLIVRWFRKNEPGVFRGQLSAPPREFRESQNAAVSLLLGRLLMNFLGRPGFIAYRLGNKPPAMKLCGLLGAAPVAWTSHDRAAEREYDTVIFEYYRPPVIYKTN